MFRALVLSLVLHPAAGGDEGVEKRVRAVSGKVPATQKKIVDTVRAALAGLDDPYLASIRDAASRAAEAPKAAKAVDKSKNGKKGAKDANGGAKEKEKEKAPRGEVRDVGLPFPLRREYVFGAGAIRERPHPASPAEELRSWLAGYPPDADLAFAGMLRDLDADRAVAEFAGFLDSWRNGEESFYEALDRAAGTPEEVFFFDAMIADFVTKFAKGSDPRAREIASELQAGHDALHGAFLVYRQYRAFREAVALSLLLPPDVPLPETLRRYEEAPEGALSVRDELAILLEWAGNDVGAIVKIVASDAPALPTPIWTAPYDGVAPFHAAFQKRLPEITRKTTTADLLAHAKARRAQLGKRMAEAAGVALAAAGVP